MAFSAPLTPKEREKLTTINRAIRKEITNSQATKLLGVSLRQVKRLKRQVRLNGASGVVHQLKGRAGNHQLPPAVKDEALAIIRRQYPDFKPSFAAEKLRENHQLKVSPETVRRWLIAEGLWKPHRQKAAVYRSWRARKESYGELEQFDGSYHYWLEDRYPDKDGTPRELCLLAAIDDATGRITRAAFAAHEGVVPVFTFWRDYLLALGKPLGIYLDSFSTYKINHKNAPDNQDLRTQFQRAMGALAVTLVTAHSPEAKGRVERLFQTLQDRLVKELRLARISTPAAANSFLSRVFIPKFNQQFSVAAAKEGDLHRPLTWADKANLNRVFSRQTSRRVNSDFTVQFSNQWYQLLEIQPVTIRPKEEILVEVWLDDSVNLSLKGKYLRFKLLAERPVKSTKQPVILTTHKLHWKPPPNHPWRRP